MARGLSPLQTAILYLAWDQRPSRQADINSLGNCPADIYPQDLYVRYYGWPRAYGWGLHPWGGWYFCPAQIGERTYRTVKAAVSRSFHRLERRGLLKEKGPGWSLTDAGLTVVEQLSVNNPQNLEIVNHYARAAIG